MAIWDSEFHTSIFSNATSGNAPAKWLLYSNHFATLPNFGNFRRKNRERAFSGDLEGGSRHIIIVNYTQRRDCLSRFRACLTDPSWPWHEMHISWKFVGVLCTGIHNLIFPTNHSEDECIACSYEIQHDSFDILRVHSRTCKAIFMHQMGADTSLVVCHFLVRPRENRRPCPCDSALPPCQYGGDECVQESMTRKMWSSMYLTRSQVKSHRPARPARQWTRNRHSDTANSPCVSRREETGDGAMAT